MYILVDLSIHPFIYLNLVIHSIDLYYIYVFSIQYNIYDIVYNTINIMIYIYIYIYVCVYVYICILYVICLISNMSYAYVGGCVNPSTTTSGKP